MPYYYQKNKNNLIKEKEQFVKDADYDKAAKIDKEIKDLEQKQKDLEKELLENNKKELQEKINNNNNNNSNNNICSKE